MPRFTQAQENINQVVKDAQAGSRKVRVTFKPDATSDLNYLLGMDRSGIITLKGGDRLTMMAVMQSGRWEHDENRTLEVAFTDDFDADWFIGRMRRALDQIEVA
jgi:hypothetical protein